MHSGANFIAALDISDASIVIDVLHIVYVPTGFSLEKNWYVFSYGYHSYWSGL